VLFIETY